MTINTYQVGDEAELSPSLMNRFIAEVMQQGGKVELSGNVAKVVYMPPTEKKKRGK